MFKKLLICLMCGVVTCCFGFGVSAESGYTLSTEKITDFMTPYSDTSTPVEIVSFDNSVVNYINQPCFKYEDENAIANGTVMYFNPEISSAQMGYTYKLILPIRFMNYGSDYFLPDNFTITFSSRKCKHKVSSDIFKALRNSGYFFNLSWIICIE